MFSSRRLLAGAATAALACAAFATTAGARMVGSTGPVPDSGTAYFSVTHTKGNLEYAAGNVSDKLFGTGAVSYRINLLPSGSGAYKVKATKVVFYTSKGSLVGTATATVTITATSETITDGKLKLDKGYGALKGDQLVAKFSGTANLSANQLKYTYKGTLYS